jgi:hypothetical protein
MHRHDFFFHARHFWFFHPLFFFVLASTKVQKIMNAKAQKSARVKAQTKCKRKKIAAVHLGWSWVYKTFTPQLAEWDIASIERESHICRPTFQKFWKIIAHGPVLGHHACCLVFLHCIFSGAGDRGGVVLEFLSPKCQCTDIKISCKWCAIKKLYFLNFFKYYIGTYEHAQNSQHSRHFFLS